MDFQWVRVTKFYAINLQKIDRMDIDLCMDSHRHTEKYKIIKKFKKCDNFLTW